MKQVGTFIRNHLHGLWIVAYLIFYLICFFYLEQIHTSDRTIIEMEVDDHLPFIEAFVIPYYMWFGYVAFAVILLILQNKKEYYKSCVFLVTGMTLFLLISALWPNGLLLRPRVMPRDNLFTDLLTVLYRVDTATNVWPSIHVYNSIGAHIAITRSAWGQKRALRIGSLILCISIILSTMLIKQHSVFDVVTALALAVVMYVFVYRPTVLHGRIRRLLVE